MGMFDDLAPQKGAPTGGGMFDDLVSPKKAKGFGERLNDEITQIPRQVGLTARYGIEGAGDALDFLSSPIRAGLNMVLPKKSPTITDLVVGKGAQKEAIPAGSGKYLADLIGLPTPQNATERVVADASRSMATVMLPVAGAGRAAQTANGATKTVLQALGSNPGAQLTSAAGAGGAGGYTRETGGDAVSQAVASVGGGLLAPMGLAGMSGAANAAKNTVQRFTQRNPQEVDFLITETLKNTAPGMKLSDISGSVLTNLRRDVQQALSHGDVDKTALSRLVDYRLIGATPRRGNLTLDPVEITRQKNLAKLGANSSDEALNTLARIENENNRTLIDSLNKLGADKGNIYGAGERVIGSIRGRDAAAKASENALYEAAKNAAGRDVPLDRSFFGNRVDELLAQNNKGAFLPGEVRNLVNSITKGQTVIDGKTFEVPFNVNAIDQLKTTIATAQRGTMDGNVRTALGYVRQALDEVPIARIDKPQFGGNQIVNPATAQAMQQADNLPQEAMDAFNRARRFARARRNWQESSPAIEAALDDVPADKFVEQFIVGNGTNANAMDVFKLRNQLRSDPEAFQATKQAITTWLKDKALGGAADEVGNFSQSNYNKALKQLGDRKLGAFFSPEEMANMKAVGRVASYEQFQPKGSAVNNSNTAGTAMAGVLDWIGNSQLLSRVPFASEALRTPARNWAAQIRINDAMNLRPGLLTSPPKQLPEPMLPLGILMGPAMLGQEN